MTHRAYPIDPTSRPLRNRWASLCALGAMLVSTANLHGQAMLEQVLQSAVQADHVYFGWNVAISGDTLVVGPNVYQRGPSGWQFVQELTRQDYPPNYGVPLNHYSTISAIQNDTIVIGVPSETWRPPGCSHHDPESPGAAYVFRCVNGAWLQEARLMASDATCARDEQFGYSVSISDNTIVIGAPDKGGGAAYVFVRDGSTWTEQAILHHNKYTGFGLRFGASVSICGDTIAVGSGSQFGIDDGALVFTRNGATWMRQATLEPIGLVPSYQYIGGFVALTSTAVFISAPHQARTGTIFAFDEYGGKWRHQSTISNPRGLFDPTDTSYGGFGHEFSASGAFVVSSESGRSAAYADAWTRVVSVFRKSGNGWTYQQTVAPPDSPSDIVGGFRTAMDGDTLVVSSPYSTGPNNNIHEGAVFVYRMDTDGDGMRDALDSCTDTDGDGLGNPGFTSNTCPEDNCPDAANPDQADSDADGVGDACDSCPGFANSDADVDEICDALDNCPTTPNTQQTDRENDGIGDACDSCPDFQNVDMDSDGVCDGMDNCLTTPNPQQEDRDNDGIGDACDPCPDFLNIDQDSDGVCDGLDNCPTVPNTDQADQDNDRVGDICDNCITKINFNQRDSDLDGIGDLCEDPLIPPPPNPETPNPPDNSNGIVDPPATCGMGASATFIAYMTWLIGRRSRTRRRRCS